MTFEKLRGLLTAFTSVISFSIFFYIFKKDLFEYSFLIIRDMDVSNILLFVGLVAGLGTWRNGANNYLAMTLFSGLQLAFTHMFLSSIPADDGVSAISEASRFGYLIIMTMFGFIGSLPSLALFSLAAVRLNLFPRHSLSHIDDRLRAP